MQTREALLKAIIADPDDDTARLAYADFLDETGEPADAARAELIRSQIATALLPDDPEKPSRVEREVKFTDCYKRVWFDWVRNPSCLPYPKRGFLDHWSCGSEAGHREDLTDAFQREPITDVTLFPAGPDLPEFAHNPQLARVRTLKLWPGEPAESDLLEFLSSPHLTRLREFEYMGRIDTRVPFAEACRLLSARPQYASLRSLRIQSAGVGIAGAAALGSHSSTLTGLTSLTLDRCDIAPPGFVHMTNDSPFLAKVTHLSLTGNARQAHEGEVLARALAFSPHLGRLESLALDLTAFTDQAASDLASAKWPNLQRLSLSPIDPSDSPASVALPAMTTIGTESLVAASWFAGIEALDLSGHPIGDEGALAIARAKLPRLRTISLIRTGLTAHGLLALVTVYAGQLEHLQLYGNPLGDTGAEVIAAAAWPKMTPGLGDGRYQNGLYLGGCEIGDRGARAFLASTTIPRDIPNLHINGHSVSPELESAVREKYKGYEHS